MIETEEAMVPSEGWISSARMKDQPNSEDQPVLSIRRHQSESINSRKSSEDEVVPAAAATVVSQPKSKNCINLQEGQVINDDFVSP